MARPSSWQQVVTPSRPRFHGRALGVAGGWRSVVDRSSSGSSGRKGTGRGQPNDLERDVARDAIDRGEDDGFNPLNAGGKVLLGLLDVLDTPRAIVTAGLYGERGLLSEDFDWDTTYAEAARNLTFGEATGLNENENLPAWARTAAGFAGDVALDPLSFVSPKVLNRPGPQGGKAAARKLLSDESVEFLGKAAAEGRSFVDDAERAAFVQSEGRKLAQQGAQKALRFQSNQALSRLEREAIGAKPGTFVNLPGTGRVGRTLQINRLMDAVTGGRFTAGQTGTRAVRLTRKELGLGRAAGFARARVAESKLGSAIADKFTKYPILRNQIIRGTPEDAAKAFMELTAIGRGTLQRRLFEDNFGRSLDNILRDAKKAGVDGEDLWLAAGESADVVGPATARVEARAPGLTERAKTFFQEIEQAANDIDPDVPWLMGQQDYTPRIASEEAAARRGSEFGAPTGGAGRLESFDMRRKFGPYEGQVDELMGHKILTPEAHPKSMSVEQQISEILRNEGLPNWYETNAYKAFPDYVRRLSKRFGDEYGFKMLRDAGFAESRLREIISEKGVSQGQAKATILKMINRSKQRALTATAERLQGEKLVDSALRGEGRAKGLADTARRELDTAQKKLLDELIVSKDLPAVKEWATWNTTEAQRLAEKRAALLEERVILEMGEQNASRLEAHVSEQLSKETQRVYSHVTELESKISKMYDELADLYDRAAHLDTPKVDYKGARAELEKRIPILEKRLREFSTSQRTSIFNDMGQNHVWGQLKELRAAADDPELFTVWAQENFTLNQLDAPDEFVESVSREIADLQGQLDEAEGLLAEMSPVVSTHDTDRLQGQLAGVDARLEELLSERNGLVASGLGASEELMAEIETLANLKGSLVHEIGVVERARGRVAEIGENAEAIAAQMDLLRNAEAIGDSAIHSIFPELPAEIHGSRVREWAKDRMGEIQSQIDDTQSQILSSYTDRDSLRVELDDISKRRRTAQRKLKEFDKKTSVKADALTQQEAVLLEKAESAMNEAIEIEAELAQFDDMAPGMVSEALEAARIDAEARKFVAAMHAKRLNYEAKQLVLEANEANAVKVARTWKRIGNANLGKDVETALERTLAHNYKQLGAVSMVKDQWMVDAIKTATVLRERGTVRSILGIYDKALSLWKGYALSTPGTVLRNLFGGVFNNYLAADVAVADYATFLRAAQAWDGPGFSKLPKDVQEAYTAIRKAGMLTGGGTSLEIEKRLMAPKGNLNPLSTDFKYTRFFRNRQEEVENFLRGSLAMKVLRDGGTIDDAYDAVIKFHFDYDDLSAAERSIARRIVPFYTWTRKNFPLMLEQIVQQPQKFTRFYQLKNEIELNSPEEAIVPSYFSENLAVRLPFTIGSGEGTDSRAYMLPDLPFTSLNDVSDPSIMFSQMSPFIKTPIEYFFGKQFFQGIPLRDSYTPVPRVMTAIPGVMPALQAVGKAERNADGTWSMKQKDLYMVEQFLPSFGKARRLFPSEEKYTDRAVTTWLSFVFGLGLRANTPQDVRNEAFRRVSREFEDRSTASELGFVGENEKKPRYGQTVNAAYEMLGVEKED